MPASATPAIRSTSDVRSASGKIQTFGYHNTFHTHALASIAESAPPSYELATSPHRGLRSNNITPSHPVSEILPSYKCTLQFEGLLALRTELSTPFLESLDRHWYSVYAVLFGTQLSIFRIKSNRGLPSASPIKGRLLRTYSLQHAEVGLAVDYDGREIVPKSLFAKLMPKAALKKLWHTDPRFFEPSREYVLRLRIEEETILLCSDTHENMLDWVELIGAAIDISQPLEDRSEPRYRSLPRRSRRQRQIEEGALERNHPATNEELEARLIAQQQRLFRRLYPHLAQDSPASGARLERTITSGSELRRAVHRQGEAAHEDAEDLDPADVRDDGGEGSTSRPNSAGRQASTSSLQERAQYDPKTAPERATMRSNALCRFRRRCAPILLASSPRASPIIFQSGHRYQLDIKRYALVPFDLLPPRYDASKETVKATLASVLDNEDSITRPIFETFMSGTSQWTAASAGVEEEEHADVDHDGHSLHSTATGGELCRIETTTEESGSGPGAKGKGKAIFLSVRKLVRPAKSGHGEQDHDEITVATYAAPLLV
ncbi:Mitochondrial-processing peptidase subunit beta [Venturia nashicola]|uniref:Mitochondrial-processing peptidase subunit beta n=1 Tax=Venturia nashicola TaxID=86259 RepID=A0A4Z1PGB4_9PEZI|nr:Mitochondrial-processing peptidase subunit beta [Venturia nashicola]